MKLTNDKASFRDLQSVKKIEKKEKKTNSKPEFISKKSLSDIKASAIAAMFLLPAIGVRSCYNPQEKKENKIEYTDKISTELSTEDIYEKYTDFKPQRIYVVKKGDTPDKIAQNHNVSTMRLLAENNLTTKSIIQPNDELWIPESYTVKNIENLDDIAKLVKLDKQYLEDLCKFETFSNKIYYDANGNATIGVGHLVKPEELNKYQGKTLTDKEVYELLAQDMFERDLDFETILEGDAYYKMPIALKSQVLDLIFNKGLGAVTSNEKLINALNNGDYVTAVANLNQDYSIVTNAKGEKVKKHLSGLSKRRLYNMSQASKIFEKGIPDEVLKSAKAVYSRGLVTMEQERDNGHIPKTAYENVKKEYQESAYRWFDGEIGKRPKLFSLKRKNKKEKKENVVVEKVPEHSLPKQVDNSTTIKVNGENTKWTVNSLHDDWQKTASRCKRYVKRPMPEIDKNGNITALVKVLDSQGTGAFNSKTIIINPGHGGAVNNKEKENVFEVKKCRIKLLDSVRIRPLFRPPLWWGQFRAHSSCSQRTGKPCSAGQAEGREAAGGFS